MSWWGRGRRPRGGVAARWGNHPLVHTLSPEEGTSSIKVAQARETMELLGLRALPKGRQFLIVDPAEAMTRQTQDAMLKTIEEPPARTHIFLVASHSDSRAVGEPTR